MARTIIIDDEPLARSVVKEYLQKYPDMQVVQECNDGFEGLKAIQQFQPDIIFLDIQMPKINGFEMLELLDPPPAVIFTTAFDEFAIRAFENHAVDYLLKPFSQERFDKAMRRWEEQQGGQAAAESTESLLQTVAMSAPQNQRIVVKTGSKIKIIPVEDVFFLEASDDYVKVQTAEGAFLKNRTMAHFEKTLEASRFVRTHRSFMVNIQEIVRIDPYEKDNHVAVLRNGALVPVSRSGYARLRQVLGI